LPLAPDGGAPENMLERLKSLGWKKLLAVAVAAGAVLSFVGVLVLYLLIAPELPSTESLRDVRFQVPLRVFSNEGKLIAEFGEKKRVPIRIDNVPDLMVKAVLAAEDDRFYEHPGVDYQGLLRAAYVVLSTGERAQGGSTITMQVARNFFLSSERTYGRKLSEILLALKIERDLTKNDILELYLNKIYLGNRAYGVAAAAKVYYGVDIGELTLDQIAMIAGLPKAPSTFNPIVNPERAMTRRNYVLRRLRELGHIDEDAFQAATNAPNTAKLHQITQEVDAPYAAEMARAFAVEKFGNDAYTEGYNVYTTIDGRLQPVANDVLRTGIVEYDERHGYRGPEAHVDLAAGAGMADWDEALKDYSTVGGLFPALVLAVKEQKAAVYLGENRKVEIDWNGMSWARPFVSENSVGPAPATAGEILRVGDIVRVRQNVPGQWRLQQLPAIEGAIISVSPADGSIRSVVGGFDFFRSKFNRAAQAERQPGSSFKPFIYSAAIEHGYTTATLVNDAPVVFDDPGLESTWRPENYSGKFYGPTRLREGLVNSRNLISIRILQAIGVDAALRHVAKFGFNGRHLPRNLSLALGSGTVTPMELVTGYSVIANGGFRVAPYLVKKITDDAGTTVYEAEPEVVCAECEALEATDSQAGDVVPVSAQVESPPKVAPRVVSAQNIFLTTSMMKDVIRRGTGKRAMQLQRNDLAGKTGTTNDQRDTWFAGFNADVVTVVWLGFDNSQPLGDGESGARAALPMWIGYMQKALESLPEHDMDQPQGIVSVRIDPLTGRLAGADNRNAIFELFKSDTLPKATSDDPYAEMPGEAAATSSGGGEAEQLF
jgi:penicillin-binding protein 1A